MSPSASTSKAVRTSAFIRKKLFFVAESVELRCVFCCSSSSGYAGLNEVFRCVYRQRLEYATNLVDLAGVMVEKRSRESNFILVFGAVERNPLLVARDGADALHFPDCKSNSSAWKR